jgi:DNA modification methylase
MSHSINIEYVPVADLIPYAANSRTHSDVQVTQIAASIREFGFTNPILVNGENTIIAGHGRLMAAKKLGLDEVPVICLDHLSKAQQKALVIADNQLALNAGWDIDMLKVEIEGLQLEDFDLDLLGFDDKFLDGLLEPEPAEGLTDEDAVPDVPETPKTVLGDVWVLGNHRLMCGDSTSIDAVDKLMAGVKADMIFTDPPYGMSYGGGALAGSTPKGALVKAHGPIMGDDKTGDDLIALVRDAVACSVSVSKAGAAAYICFPWRTYSEFEAALNECGLKPSACIVWDKKSIGLGNSNYRPQHEFIFYIKGGSWFGDKAQSDVWYMSRGNTSAYVHPTQKPVELIERALNNSSKAGDVVIDCFGGSGSTLIACEKNNRNARLMELDPKHVDAIIKRWQDFTGKEAIHAETGLPFNEMTNVANS